MSVPLPFLESETSGQAALAAGIETCDAVEGLAAINRPNADLVIWSRALPLCLTVWLERMEAARLPELRVLVRPGDFRAAVEPQLDGCGLPPRDMRDLLIGDVDGLVAAFSKVTRSDLVDVRLERISNDACWKFHRDSVEARLLTTYRGPGTEWVQPALSEQALQEQKQFEGPVEQLGIYDVAIFKGSFAGAGKGIVHRSPPVAGSGHTRLLLCLNTPSHASPDPWPQG